MINKNRFNGNVNIEEIKRNPEPFSGVDEDGNLYIIISDNEDTRNYRQK